MSDLPDRDAVTRREYLAAAVAAGGAAGLSACLDSEGGLDDVPRGDPDAVPARQHAWNDALARRDDGAARPPRHHVLRYVDLSADAVRGGDAGDRDGVPTAAARDRFADALAALERAFEWSNEGLLFTVGYSPAYFDRFDEALPATVDLPEPEALTSLEGPEFDRSDLLLHLASDRADALLAAEAAVFDDEGTVNGVTASPVGDLLDPVDRRTGFVGAGLPRERRGVDGVPADAPIPEAAPTFMGFRAGLSGAQASEDRVTIDDGPFAGGTTQQVSALRLQLHAWWTQESHEQRVAKLFGPEHAADADGSVGAYGEALGVDSGAFESLPEDGDLGRYAAETGVVGHAQKAARARVDGEPIVLRRDVDSTDDDRAGVHFVSLQESIADFVAVREAVTGADVASASGVGARVNNGILQYVFVRRRGNFLVPPREHRALPTANP